MLKACLVGCQPLSWEGKQLSSVQTQQGWGLDELWGP